MRVQHDIKTEVVTLTFTLEFRAFARLIIADAITRYRDAGFDCSEVVSVLQGLYENELSLQ